MSTATDGHILYWTYRLFIGIHNLKALNISFFQLTAHYPRQRTYLCIIDICNFQPSCIQFVSGSHGTYYRDAFFLRSEYQFYFCCYSIYGIDYIIILIKSKFVSILRQKETLMNLYFYIRIYFKHPVTHNFCFILSNGFSCCDYLTVQISKTNFIIINQFKRTYTAPDKCLAYITSYTAYPKHSHFLFVKRLHSILTQQQLSP